MTELILLIVAATTIVNGVTLLLHIRRHARDQQRRDEYQRQHDRVIGRIVSSGLGSEGLSIGAQLGQFSRPELHEVSLVENPPHPDWKVERDDVE